jgi:nicotinamide mononucleotide (NMN) deamidase PncC
MLIDTLLRSTEDSDVDVVAAALGSMVSLASRGNMKILQVITQLLSKQQNVSAVSLALMGQTAPVGHAEAVSIAITYLAAAGGTGDAALQALGKIAARDGTSLEAVLRHVEVGDLQTKERASAAVRYATHAQALDDRLIDK